MMKNFHSPLRYPGGKNCIFKFISNLFYENQWLGMRYAEPYAGGAGLALRLLFEEYVSHIHINDYDKYIYAFWKTVTEKPNEFCDWIEDVDVTIDTWHMFKKLQKEEYEGDLFEMAKLTFFLNRTNVSGIIKGGPIGGHKQLGKYKVDARFNKETLIQRVQKIAKFRERILVSNLDGLAFVKKMQKKKEDVFIYLDPPYYQKGSQLYMNYFSKEDHEKLSKQVHKVKDKWMVSYDNHDFILNLYEKKRRLRYSLSQSASNRIGNEIVIFSDDMNFQSSMNYLKNPICIS
jgi:DNA adenine methylase